MFVLNLKKFPQSVEVPWSQGLDGRTDGKYNASGRHYERHRGITILKNTIKKHTNSKS